MFWDGLPQVVLPVDHLTGPGNVIGNQVFDAPAGEWWLARPFDDAWPRVALVRGAGALGRLTLPFGGAPASYEPILAGALSPDSGWAGTGGEWLAWNSLGYVARVDVRSAAVQTVVPPLISAAEVTHIPGAGLNALRVPHGTALDTRAELLLDGDGVPLGSFGIADRGEPLLLGDSLVTARATATTLVVTPYVGGGSNLHSELDNATVYDLQDPENETCIPNDGMVYTRLLAPGGSVVADSCRGTQHACPSADPEDPTASPAKDPNRIYLWHPDLASSDPSPAIQTDLCGAGTEVLAVLPRPESDDLLVVWTIDYTLGAGTLSVSRTMASIVQVAGGQYVNVSGDRLGSAGRVGWPIDLDSGAQQLAGWTYDSVNDRFLLALNQGMDGATVFGVWPDTLSVGAPFDLPAPVTAFAGSPDSQRFYLLVGTEVLVFANRAVTGIPKLLGRASLPSVGTSLGVSENGETLIVGLDDGYCAISD